MTFENGLNLWRTFTQNYQAEQLALCDGPAAIKYRFHGYIDDLNLTNIWDNIDSTQDQIYWYSPSNTLQNADGPWGEDAFYVDGSGNRVNSANVLGGAATDDQYDYSGSDNRLLGINRNGAPFRSFTYDGAGNIATEVQGGVTTAYTYNDADRLASVTRAGTLRGEYTYNARGQLVIRTVTNSSNNGTTVYFYDLEGRVIAEYDGATGTVKREYVWLGDRPVAIFDPGSPSDDIYYVHADHLNRPIAMTDAGKNLVAEFTWRAFGELSSYTGTVGLDLRFPGQMLQAESGLYYNWFRQYDPTTGRYTQPDPLGLVDGPSCYAYVSSDPLQNVDPTGLASIGAPKFWVRGGTWIHPRSGSQYFYGSAGTCIMRLDFHFDHGAGTPHLHIAPSPAGLPLPGHPDY